SVGADFRPDRPAGGDGRDPGRGGAPGGELGGQPAAGGEEPPGDLGPPALPRHRVPLQAARATVGLHAPLPPVVPRFGRPPPSWTPTGPGSTAPVRYLRSPRPHDRPASASDRPDGSRAAWNRDRPTRRPWHARSRPLDRRTPARSPVGKPRPAGRGRPRGAAVSAFRWRLGRLGWGPSGRHGRTISDYSGVWVRLAWRLWWRRTVSW